MAGGRLAYASICKRRGSSLGGLINWATEPSQQVLGVHPHGHSVDFELAAD